MLLYLAGSLSPEKLEMCADRAPLHAPIRKNVQWDQKTSPNFLFTFAHADARKCAEYFCVQPNRRIFIDSGAYTVWSKGKKPIDINEYIAFCKKIQGLAKCPVTFIALDIIPGKPGVKPTPKEAEEACEKGWENYQAMKRAEIPCLVTFHQFDHWRWLARIAKDSESFAISHSKDESVPRTEKHYFVESVFRDIGRSKKIHGLGVSSTDWLMEFPFFSADNTDWQWPAKTKRYPMPDESNWSVKDWENRF